MSKTLKGKDKMQQELGQPQCILHILIISRISKTLFQTPLDQNMSFVTFKPQS